MSPLDALTQARIRSLEIVLAWLIEKSMPAVDPGFNKAAMVPTYIMDLAEKIGESLEEEDA